MKLEVIKSRIPAIKIRQETEKEAQQKKEETRKKNDPSPFSYKVEESFMRTQAKKTFQIKISKAEHLKFTGKTHLSLILFRFGD